MSSYPYRTKAQKAATEAFISAAYRALTYRRNACTAEYEALRGYYRKEALETIIRARLMGYIAATERHLG